jgi:hypothetical protein
MNLDQPVPATQSPLQNAAMFRQQWQHVAFIRLECRDAFGRYPRDQHECDTRRRHGNYVYFIHTSGHASPADLRAFAAAVHPRIVVPVHGVKWDEEAERFGSVRRLGDAEPMAVP